jgi:hypothetical protein
MRLGQLDVADGRMGSGRQDYMYMIPAATGLLEAHSQEPSEKARCG